MILPSFDDFIVKRADIPVEIYDKVQLPPNPSVKMIEKFAERTALQTTMIVLEQYHQWLDGWLTTLGNND